MTKEDIMKLKAHCEKLMVENPGVGVLTICWQEGSSWAILYGQFDIYNDYKTRKCNILPCACNNKGKEIWSGRKLNAFIEAANKAYRLQMNPSLRRIYIDAPDFPTVTI